MKIWEHNINRGGCVWKGNFKIIAKVYIYFGREHSQFTTHRHTQINKYIYIIN